MVQHGRAAALTAQKQLADFRFTGVHDPPRFSKVPFARHGPVDTAHDVARLLSRGTPMRLGHYLEALSFFKQPFDLWFMNKSSNMGLPPCAGMAPCRATLADMSYPTGMAPPYSVFLGGRSRQGGFFCSRACHQGDNNANLSEGTPAAQSGVQEGTETTAAALPNDSPQPASQQTMEDQQLQPQGTRHLMRQLPATTDQ